MNTIDIGKSGLKGSEIVLGCMRMDALSVDEAATVIQTAYDSGINFYDHADIYGDMRGISEERFASAIKKTSLKREDIILQSKCGIRKHPSGNHNYFDFSYDHIIEAVDGILKRLETDYIDVLLLHRPDTLMEPDEIAKAFDKVEKDGKVRHFGVSNQHPMHIEMLKKSVKQDLIANQLQFSPVHTGMINCGMEMNMKTEGAVDHDGLILEYCRLENMTIQAWSPYQHGMIKGVFLTNAAFDGVNNVIRRLAEEKSVTDTAIVAAWILRHPAKMQVIAGSMNPQRISDICKASGITITREEWYEIYHAAGNIIP